MFTINTKNMDEAELKREQKLNDKYRQMKLTPQEIRYRKYQRNYYRKRQSQLLLAKGLQRKQLSNKSSDSESSSSSSSSEDESSSSSRSSRDGTT
jgi:hypothetical protein